MRKLLIISFILGLFTIGCASSKKAAEPSKEATAAKSEQKETSTAAAKMKATGEVVCKNGTDERKLTVKEVEPKGCELLYTKFGKTSAIASSQYSNAHCETVQKRIKEKLSSAGFACE